MVKCLEGISLLSAALHGLKEGLGIMIHVFWGLQDLGFRVQDFSDSKLGGMIVSIIVLTVINIGTS